MLANCAKMFGNQSVLIEQMLMNLKEHMLEHFEYQQHIVLQTMKPFISKIN